MSHATRVRLRRVRLKVPHRLALAMLAMLKDQFGVDVARMMQAKTDAATVAAEQQSRSETP